MAYFGETIGNDYESGKVGVYVLLIKEKMFNDMATVIAKSFPEQSIVASVKIIRLLASEYPKSVSVHFGKKELLKAESGFAEWYDLVCEKIRPPYRDRVLKEAEAEFSRFRNQIFSAAS